MCSIFCQKLLFFGLGGGIMILGGLVSAIWPFIFNQELRNQLVLNSKSKSFNLWKETPIPMYIDFYMFNWTNPEETLNKNAVPHFVEIGPYVFREEHKKVNINWNSNGTVTFKQIRKWTFQPQLSNGELSDKITNVNVIAMTIGDAVRKMVPKTLYRIVDTALKKLEEKVYVTKTVGELLFDGYNDVFLDLVKKLKHILKINLPMDKFGWFYNRNMSADYDGVFNMVTGDASLNSLGLLKTWNYRSRTNFFYGQCGAVEGSTGELWPVDAASKSIASIFATDLCSKVDAEWLGTADIHGASGSVFTGTQNTFTNDTFCYCIDHQCHPTGVREISTCRYGAPAFISFPHFYLADPSFRVMVSGMEPIPEKHIFDLTLHKTTGVPLSVNARLQINILVDKIPGLSFYQRLPKAYMPMLWFNQRALITPDLASQLSEIEILNWIEPGFFAIAGVGVVLFFIGLFFWSKGKWKQSSLNSPLLQDSTSS